MKVKINQKMFSFSSELVRYAVILFIAEFVRGAYLISFLPSYAVEHLGFTVSLIGVIVSVHYFSDTIVKIFAGYLLDRFSLRIILQSGLFIAFVGLWTMYNIHSPWALIASAAIFGIGISPVWLICLSNVNEENRAEQMGLLYSLWLAGLGLGPVVTNFLLDKSYSLSFWLMTCLWVIGFVLSLGVNPTKQYTFNSIPAKIQIKMFWSRLRTMGPLFPGMILQTLAASMLIPILPNFAVQHLGLSHANYSFMMILGGVSTIIFLIPMGRLTDRFGGKWFMICGFSSFAFTLYGLTLVSSYPITMGLAILLGLSYAAVLPAWNALLAHFIPVEQKGVGWGLFSSLEGIGIILGPMIGGFLAVRFSDSMAFLVSALLFFGISMFYLVFPTSSFREDRHRI
ncbi:MAG: transporter [Bacilli bacterium]|nr:transporter [Bacilli bacterium]